MVTITRDGNDLVLRVSLTQPQYNPYMTDDEPVGETDNLIGIIAGDEYHISYLIDMEYKDKGPQEGMPLIMFYDREELVKVCGELGLEVWEHPSCGKCKKVLRGVFGWGEKGAQCMEHEREV